MAAVQADDVHASLLFVVDLNGVATFDFTTMSGCDQLVVGPTHSRGGTLDQMTDVQT